MSQRELARRAHITTTYVSKLEAGGVAPGIDLVERIAGALDVPVVELLPSPTMTEPMDTYRRQAKAQFEAVLAKAGRESISMVNLFLVRLLESPSLSR